MGEAKEQTSLEPSDLWRGPRAVLVPFERVVVDAAVSENCRQVQASGYDGVLWDLRAISGAQVLSLLAQAHDAGVSSGSLAIVCDTTDASDAVARIKSVMESAARCGARSLCVTLPPLIPTGTDGVSGPGSIGFRRYQDQINFASMVLRETRRTGGRTGVTLALEAPAGRGLSSPVELRELIDGAYDAAVGICLDLPGVGDAGFAPDWITTLRQRLYVVRLSPAAQDLGMVLTALVEARFQGTLICPEASWIPQCRAVLSQSD